jgi:L-fuculose-phosphate aldolase
MSDMNATLVDALISAGRRLDALGLVTAADGNLSARLGPDRFLITATGVPKGELTPEDLVVVDAQGRPEGGSRPSLEVGLHLAVYRLRPDVQAVVHAHPPTALGFALAGRDLTRPLVPEVVVHLGSVPLAPYAMPGSPELEASIASLVPDHQGILLANHGAITLGTSVRQALHRMETLEHLARITLVADVLGGPRPLSAPQVEALLALASPAPPKRSS